jgi:hypothetical protein
MVVTTPLIKATSIFWASTSQRQSTSSTTELFGVRSNAPDTTSSAMVATTQVIGTLWASTSQRHSTAISLSIVSFSTTLNVATTNQEPQMQTSSIVRMSSSQMMSPSQVSSAAASSTTPLTTSIESMDFMVQSSVNSGTDIPTATSTSVQVSDAVTMQPTSSVATGVSNLSSTTTKAGNSTSRLNFGAVLLSYYNRNAVLVSLAALSFFALFFSVLFQRAARCVMRQYSSR